MAPSPRSTVRRGNDFLVMGADAAAANRYGVQPIALAATNGSAAMLEVLLAAGADPNAAMPGGETALMTAARAGPAVGAVHRPGSGSFAMPARGTHDHGHDHGRIASADSGGAP